MNEGIDRLTITEASKYTGFSRISLLKWIHAGTLDATQETINGRNTWTIEAKTVEMIRRNKVAELEKQLRAVSRPVPGVEG